MADGIAPALDRATRAVHGALTGINRAVRDQQRAIDQEFEAQYRGLARLAGSRFTPAASAMPPAPVVESVSAETQAIRGTLDQRRDRAAAGGFAAGLMVGQALIPVPVSGALVCAGVGRLLGAVPSGGRVASRRAAYWKQLEPEVRSLFRDVDSRYQGAVRDHGEAATRHLDTRVAGYHRTYAETISALVAETQAPASS